MASLVMVGAAVFPDGMKRILLRIGIGFGLFAVGWHVFEFFWDRQLFPASESVRVVNLSVAEAAELLEGGRGIQAVDVRPEKVFVSGHLPGAVRIEYGKGELDSVAAEELDRETPLLVYCDGGFRSRLALKAFEEEGFREIYHLHRGMLSWRLQGRPCEDEIAKPDSEEAESNSNRTDL